MSMIVTKEGWKVRPIGGAIPTKMMAYGSSAKKWACGVLRHLRVLKTNEKDYSLEMFFRDNTIGGFESRNELLVYVVQTTIWWASKVYRQKYTELGCHLRSDIFKYSDEQHARFCGIDPMEWLKNYMEDYNCNTIDQCREHVTFNNEFLEKADKVFTWPVLSKFLIKVLRIICTSSDEEEEEEEAEEEEEEAEEEEEEEEEPEAATGDYPYEIEKIVDIQKEGRKNKYLIKWKGYDDSSNQWMTYNELKNSFASPGMAQISIKDYNRQNS